MENILNDAIQRKIARVEKFNSQDGKTVKTVSIYIADNDCLSCENPKINQLVEFQRDFISMKISSMQWVVVDFVYTFDPTIKEFVLVSSDLKTTYPFVKKITVEF